MPNHQSAAALTATDSWKQVAEGEKEWDSFQVYHLGLSSDNQSQRFLMQGHSTRLDTLELLKWAVGSLQGHSLGEEAYGCSATCEDFLPQASNGTSCEREVMREKHCLSKPQSPSDCTPEFSLQDRTYASVKLRENFEIHLSVPWLHYSLKCLLGIWQSPFQGWTVLHLLIQFQLTQSMDFPSFPSYSYHDGYHKSC